GLEVKSLNFACVLRSDKRMGWSRYCLLGLFCLIFPVITGTSDVIENEATVLGRKAKLLDLSAVFSKSKFDNLFGSQKAENVEKNTERDDHGRSRFFNVLKKSSQSPYEMLIDCLILVIPEKIDTLQEICENIQILLDLRIQENTINFDSLATVLMNAIVQFLNTLNMAIQNLQRIAGLAPTPTTAPVAPTVAPTPTVAPLPVVQRLRRDEIRDMIQEILRSQQMQIRAQEEKLTRNPKSK
ncbi:UNVERIFIED_CONTAM: hypothetical protein RMT77_019517, partial [Armadillidium vulgare]